MFTSMTVEFQQIRIVLIGRGVSVDAQKSPFRRVTHQREAPPTDTVQLTSQGLNLSS